MGFHRSLPEPVLGMSTLAALNRPEGLAEDQLNMRSDEREKLTRRPSLQAVANLSDSGLGALGDDIKWHEYYRNGKHYLLAVNTQGIAYVWVDNIFIDSVALLAGPFDTLSDFNFETIYDDTYIINTQKTVLTNSTGSLDGWGNRAHINIVSALNYAEKIELTAYYGTMPFITVEYEVPGLDGSNQAEADEARATNTVATALGALLDAHATLEVHVKGSNIGIKGNGSDLRLEVSSGRGDSTIAIINSTVTSPSGVPLYAIEGTSIRVRPNPITKDGTFYLKASAVDDSNIGLGNMVEVVWAESQDPEDTLTIDPNTLPNVVSIDTSVEPAVVSTYIYNAENRLTGDNDSNFGPTWLDSTITSAGLFQDRLLFLTENKASLSATDDTDRFFLASATELQATDATEVGSSANSSKLRHAVFHNRDMLIFADNAQFKLDGQAAFTASTGAMPQTTSNEVDNTVKPVQMGNAVIFATSYGDSVGLREYRAEVNTNADVSTSITEQVIGLLQGHITNLSANPNQTMLVVRSSESPDNEFYVFEGQQITRNGERVIAPSWSRWAVPDIFEILNVSVGLQKVNVVARHKETNVITLQQLDLHARISTDRTVYLDNRIKVTTAGTTLELPDGYIMSPDTKVVLGDNTAYPLQWMLYTQVGNTLHFDFDVGVGDAYVGIPYRSSYTPTRPFSRDRNGNARDTDRMYIAHYSLTLSNTYEVTRRIISDLYDIPDNKFSSRIGGEIIEYVDEVAPYSGEHRFDVGMDADHCTVEFFTDGYLALNITGIGYRGQQTQTVRRG